MQFLLKTDLAIDKTVATHVRELDLTCTNDFGSIQGIVLVEDAPTEALALLEKIPEIQTILPVDVECPADLDAMVAAGLEVAREKLSGDQSFAVRCTRRGAQAYSSVDVEVALGAVVNEELGCHVDLTIPDQTLYVEIIQRRAFICAFQGQVEQRKSFAGDIGRRVADHTSIIQLPYLYHSDVSTSMGHRIGRAAQAFGVKELIIGLEEMVGATDLMRFIEGLTKGRKTRYDKAKNIKEGRLKRVPIHVTDLYQLVRQRAEEPMIITSALGQPLDQAAPTIRELYKKKRVNIFIGSRQGIPKGVSRYADAVVNLFPGQTYATENGIPAALVGMAACLDSQAAP
ncbi:MAG: hypothetical protein GKR89_25615 [Candidatus Latescibacteria bacterium]|nr:hypothetical protein [Candidatus Latescibacterota bacterium]